MNVFPFEYDFDYKKLLAEYDTRLKKGLGYRYLAGKSYEDRIDDETVAYYSKTTVIRLKSGFAYETSKKFAELVAAEKFICHFIGYGSDDFVEWHIDKRPVEYCINASRINIFLTGESYTTFRDGDHWYRNAAVNVMGAEHRYDNRNQSKRVMLQIALKGITHAEMCNILQTI